MLRGGVAAVLIAAAVLLVYWNSLSGPFVYDDIEFVASNSLVRETAGPAAFLRSPHPPGRPELGLYRPVAGMSYALDAAVSGMDPRRFHVTNVGLHALVSVLVMLLLIRLELDLPAAAVGALVFALHPVHTEAVSWITGRAELLAALFVLMSTLLYHRHRRRGSIPALALSVVCYAIACGSKEIAVALPAVLLAGDWLEPGETDSALGPRIRRSAAVAGVFLATFVAYGAARVGAIGSFGMVEESTVFVGESFGARIAVALAGVSEYVRLSLVPIGLRADYGEFGRGDPLRTVAGVAALAGMTVLAWRCARRTPRVTMAIVWFGAFLLPVSNLVVPIGSTLGERFLYLPSVAVAILAGEVTWRVARSSSAGLRTAALVTGVVIALAAGIATVSRNRVWTDPHRFWSTAVQQDPSNEKAHLALYRVLDARGERRKAEQVLRAAAALQSPTRASFTGTQAHILHELARVELAQARFEQVVAICDRLLRLVPLFRHLPDRVRIEAEAHLYRGTALFELGRPDRATAAFDAAAAARPEWPLPQLNAGRVLRRFGEPEEAVKRFRSALERDPGFLLARVDLAVTLRQLGRAGEARAMLIEALAADPDAGFRSVLDVARAAYVDNGDLQGAYDLLGDVRSLGPVPANVLLTMAWLADRLDRADLAETHREEARRAEDR